MGFCKVNSKGVKYCLHSNGRIFYFSREEEGSIDLPKCLEAKETKHSMLVVKRVCDFKKE